MTNLMLHAGANLTTANEVRLCETPPATETHFPIPHAELIQTVIDYAKGSHGYELGTQAHALTPGGMRYFGLFEVQSDRQDYNPVIGLRNSHDKAFSASLVMGSSVFVCDNLAFSGEVKIARKHTRNIMRDLPLMVERAFAKVEGVRQLMDKRIEAYKAASLTPADRDHLLMEAARNNALSWSGLGKVVQEYNAPAHQAHEFGVERDSAWYLFNCCTEVLKTRSRSGADPRWTTFLHRVFDQAVDLGEGDPFEDLIEEADWEVAA